MGKVKWSGPGGALTNAKWTKHQCNQLKGTKGKEERKKVVGEK